MDWMKSLVSPRARRKNLNLDTENSRVLTASHRIFGVPLDKLVTKTLENDTVPLVVKRICEHIYKFGLDNMDLLRTSDNSRSIENMRLQFDLMGDVNLDAEVHVSTTIGLLRIFLLQLPDTLIPRRLTENLFSVIQDTALNKTAIVCGIKTVLNLLPEENYSVLKYISSLLTVVAERRTDNNKMSASSLATLFGPSILRCDLTSDTEELRDIDYSKDIMCWLILEYNALFLQEGTVFERSAISRRFPKVHSLPSFSCSSLDNMNSLLGDENENTGKYDSNKLEEDCESSCPMLKAETSYANDNRRLSLEFESLHSSQENLSWQQMSSLRGSSVLDRSPVNGIKLFIPPLDLSTLHQHVDGVGPIPMSLDQSDTNLWIKTNYSTDPEDADLPVLSPRSYNLKNSNDYAEMETTIPVVPEAPLSPSAYFDCGLFRTPLNIDIPPSTLIQQEIYKKDSDDDCNYRLRQLTTKIQDLKKKIKHFEESFERDHGYRPSQGEKSAQPDIKKCMQELSKARKNLKRLEDTEKSNRSRHNSDASLSGVEMSPPVTDSVAITLEFVLQSLKQKRQEAGRPEEINLMSHEQLLDEKLALQKALVHFENLNDLPATCEERDLMRSLYERYRLVKWMLIKPLSRSNSLELQTVPEDQMIEIPFSVSRDSVQVPATHLSQDNMRALDLEFVTQDMAVYGGLDFSCLQDEYLQQTDEGKKSDRSQVPGADSNLHQMSLSELHVEIELSRGQKKRLGRALRKFEMDFLHKNGRKVQKEDRYPLQTVYSEYKKVKARLRLLEALILKHWERHKLIGST